MFDTKLLLQDDKKFLDLFEDISLRIKNDGFYIHPNDKEKTVKTYLEYFVKACKGRKTLLEPLVKVDGEEITPITQVGYVPDYYSIFQSLEWCGISISDKESYLLTNSIRTLLNEKSIASASFWGKIFGKEKDYYIIETPPTEAQPQEGKEPDPEVEARGSGVNKNSYFVTNNLSGPWVELDDCKPSLLKAARKIKYTFTGNLNRPVVSNPWFNGKESDLLRCQIARITHNMQIIPNVGKWKVGQEPRELEGPIDEARDPDTNECLNIKNWVHFSPSILKEGRTVHMEKEAPEGKDPDEFKKEIVSNDPFEPRLKSISNDTLIKCTIPNIKIPSWKLSYCYDDKIYTNQDIIINPEDEESLKKDTSISRVIINLRNLIWPGAHVIRMKGQIQYYYFGWGMKYSDDILEDKFVFQSFPKIQDENEDLPVGEEPNKQVEVQENIDNNLAMD